MDTRLSSLKTPSVSIAIALWTAVLGPLAGGLLGCLGAPDSLGGDSESAVTASVTQSFQNGIAPTSGYAGSTDTTLLQNTPATAHGNDVDVHADADYPNGTGQRADALLRFDVSAIPAGSTVLAVKLTLNVTSSTTGVGYSLYAASRAWTEAGATWNSTGSGAWGSGGARGTADRGTSALGTVLPVATGKYTVTLNAAGLAAVQEWVKTPASNFGFTLDTSNDMDGLVFDSAEASTPANRPSLSVTYAPPASGGTGLTGQYFVGTGFQTLALTRTDATVNFNWAAGSPGAGVPVDGFSARWTGSVTPLYSETYTFSTSSDDGVRVWVNGQELVNNWTQHAAQANSGTIVLAAGQKYALKVEYYENTGSALMQLSWASKSQAAQVIPASQLFPAGATPQPPPADAGIPPPPPPSGSSVGAGSQPVGTACTAAKVTVNATMTGAQIQAALNSAGANAYICFAAGTYRFTAALAPLAGQTLHGSAGTILKGSLVLSGAASSGSTFVFSSVPLASTGPQAYAEQWCEDPVAHPCAYIENVYSDGRPLVRSVTLGGVTAGKFYTDYAAKKVYVGSNPSGHTIEIGHASGAFRTLNPNVKIEGFIVEMFAHDMDHGAIEFTGNGTGGVVRNCEAFYNHGAGAVTWAAGTTLQYNRFHDNGQVGAQSSITRGTLMDHNDFIHNNIDAFWVDDAAEGGLKVDRSSGARITYNYVYNNNSFGIYFDEDGDNAVIEYNQVDSNAAAGIIYWISNQASIAHNTVTSNGNRFVTGRGGTGCNPIDIACNWGGIVLGDSSNVDVSDNVLSGNAAGITAYEGYRASTATVFIYNLTGNRIHDNTITLGPHGMGLKQNSGPAGFDAFAASSGNSFYNNTYHLPNLTGKYFWWKGAINAQTPWQTYGMDPTGKFLSP